MRILRTILVENTIESINQFRQFEVENSVMFSIVESVSDTSNLSELINTHKPDLVIINSNEIEYEDIIMSDLRVHKPKLLIISDNILKAYDAYRLNAIDFLKKPVDENALIISLYKIIKIIEMEAVFQNDTLGKINTINTMQNHYDYVAIASVDKIELLKIEDIIFCKADGKYTEFYTSKNQKLVSSRNLGEYTPSLDNSFFRIHHSYIVNIKYLVKIIKKDGLYCELVNGYTLPVAKRRQEDFIKFINL